jgi:hypothetical protein
MRRGRQCSIKAIANPVSYGQHELAPMLAKLRGCELYAYLASVIALQIDRAYVTAQREEKGSPFRSTVAGNWSD